MDCLHAGGILGFSWRTGTEMKAQSWKCVSKESKRMKMNESIKQELLCQLSSPTVKRLVTLLKASVGQPGLKRLQIR